MGVRVKERVLTKNKRGNKRNKWGQSKYTGKK